MHLLFVFTVIMQKALQYQVLLVLEDTMLLLIYSVLVPLLTVLVQSIMYVAMTSQCVLKIMPLVSVLLKRFCLRLLLLCNTIHCWGIYSGC